MIPVRSLIVWLLLTAAAAAQNGELHWNNGDALPGRMLGASGDQLTWECPLFSEPLTLRSAHLRGVVFDQLENAAPLQTAFRVTMQNGDRLFGDLHEIRDDMVILDSPRHGRLELQISALKSIRRINNPALIYQWPSDEASWTNPSGGAFAGWQVTSEGYLYSHTSDAEVFHALEPLEQIAVEFTLQARNELQFTLALGNDPDRSPRLETRFGFDALPVNGAGAGLGAWDNQLVAICRGQFAHITVLDLSQRTLTLRLYWNATDRELLVYSEEGQQIASLQSSMPFESEFGIYLRNEGQNLQLSELNVSRWNGESPRPVKKKQSRIHLISGDIVYGTISSFDAASGAMVVTGTNGTRQFLSAEQVDLIYFGDSPYLWPPGVLVETVFHDGGSVSGVLTELNDESITLRTSYSSKPIVSHLAGAHKLRFYSSQEEPEDAPDRLFSSAGTLHGTLTGNDDPAAPIRWRPAGGLNSSPLAANCDAVFRYGHSEAGTFDVGAFEDLLFLINQDVVPCRVESVDEESVHVVTAFAGPMEVPHGQIKAVELRRNGRPLSPYRDADTKRQALTIPRFRRDNPSTHILIAPNGDLLRGNLTTMNNQHVEFESRLEAIRFRRDQINAIVWLHPEGAAEVLEFDADAPVVRAVLATGYSIQLSPLAMTEEFLVGHSPILGRCEVQVSLIHELQVGELVAPAAETAYADWQGVPAPEPLFAGGDDASNAGMAQAGTVAGDFALTLLDGTPFQLSDHADKVVVLDFWATWCAPCIRAMPSYLETIATFDPEQVIFVAVNQAEAPPVIQEFLETRGWEMQVALDRDQRVADQFRVNGIPHTIVIGPGGTIAWAHIGFSSDAAASMQAAIDELLEQ